MKLLWKINQSYIYKPVLVDVWRRWQEQQRRHQGERAGTDATAAVWEWYLHESGSRTSYGIVLHKSCQLSKGHLCSCLLRDVALALSKDYWLVALLLTLGIDWDNPRSVLGVKLQGRVTKESLQRGFRREFREWHPDHNPNRAQEATKRTQAIIVAFEELKLEAI